MIFEIFPILNNNSIANKINNQYEGWKAYINSVMIFTSNTIS